MRNINYFDKELSVEEYVKKEVCKMPALRALLLKNSLFHYAALRVLNVTKNEKKKSCLIFFATTALNISSLLIYLE